MPRQGPAYYNNAYRREKLRNGQPNHYRAHWSLSPMLATWMKVAEMLPDVPCLSVVDIGCGVGQFAHMLYDLTRRYNYIGFDFSSEAIALAKQNLDDPCWQFIEESAHSINFGAHVVDYYVCIEMLEHITEDVELIKKMQPDTAIIISVPNHDDQGHVRFFPKKKDAIKRYGGVIEIEELEKVGKHHILRGITK